MPQAPITATLSPSEWHLVEAIRALPDSPLRERTTRILEELLFYVGSPRCQGMGVDGFPCGEPGSSCEECQAVWDLLDSIAQRVEV